MPATDPSHTASADPRKEELASLFRQWDSAGPGDGRRARAARVGLWLRGGITLLLLAAAAVVMSHTAQSFAFWREPNEARALVDLREDEVRSGGSQPLEANTHVALRGLVPTRLVALADARTPDAEAAWVFFCPLRRIVVVMSREVEVPAPDARGKPDPRLERLVVERLALPEETAIDIAATGRLLPGDEAPAELAPFVQSYAQRVQRSPSDVWLLLDGVHPASARWAAIVWALAAAAPLSSLVFFARAWRRERRAGALS